MADKHHLPESRKEMKQGAHGAKWLIWMLRAEPTCLPILNMHFLLLSYGLGNMKRRAHNGLELDGHRRLCSSFFISDGVFFPSAHMCPSIVSLHQKKNTKQPSPLTQGLDFPYSFSWMNLIYTMQQDVWSLPAFLANKESILLIFPIVFPSSPGCSRALRWHYKDF